MVANTEPRVAVRVLLLDARSRVLLFEGRDLADESDTQRWWFTAGGGVESGESLVDAARREVEEETGLGGLDLVDMHVRREVDFMNHGDPLRQVEHFFAARTSHTAIASDEWTDLERRAVTAWRWWAADELDSAQVTYYPVNLPELVRRASDLIGP